nr:hypothetical protein [Escherichia coli]
MSKGNKMLINRIAVIGLAVVAAATQAGVPPVIFYRDTVPVSITLDEPATGCSMAGVIVHPVDRPAAKWRGLASGFAVKNVTRLALSVMKLAPRIT